MRILLDESLPHKLRFELHEHDVKTVAWMGWSGIKNGQLLNLASQSFDVFITVDQNLEYQQNLDVLPVAVIVLVAQDIRIQTLRLFVPEIIVCLNSIVPKTLERVPKMLSDPNINTEELL